MANRLVSVDASYRFPTPLEARLAGTFAGLVEGRIKLDQLPSDALVTDENVASKITSPLTGAAIDGRINTRVAPVVEQITADYIASDEAVVDAAAAAVNANPKIATIEAANIAQDSRLTEIEDTAVFDGDRRLVETADTDELSFAVVDADGRRTWIEADMAGNPTQRVLDLLGGSGQGSPALPVEDWAHWGDSLTDERVLGTDGWVSKLAAFTGKNHYNGGWYGQTAVEIAARQGGLPAVVTLPSDMIPASGAVTVTEIRNSPVEVHASLGVYGTLAGVHGFMQEPTTDVTTFTRTTPGDPTPCPPGSRFIADKSVEMQGRTVTIWVARNDVYWTDPQMIVATVKSMIDYLSPRVKRALVMEVVPSETSTATHAKLLAINEALKSAFPAEWFPIATWLRTEEAATAAGITFTTDDQTDIAAGITPRSFRMDGVHLNAAGCNAVAYGVRQEAQKRGWLA